MYWNRGEIAHLEKKICFYTNGFLQNKWLLYLYKDTTLSDNGNIKSNLISFINKMYVLDKIWNQLDFICNTGGCRK